MAKGPGEYGFEDVAYQAIGGLEGVRQLVDHFYDLMDAMPAARRIREMHPEDLALSREKLTAFFSGWLGGPRLYQERWGTIRIPPAHAHLSISPLERDAWLACMVQALERMNVDDAFKEYFLGSVAVPASFCVNRPEPES